MQVIFPFDPWKSKLCTCPPKYSFSPYTGCGHGCVYCYASSYIPRFFSPRPKKDLTKRLLSDLKKLDKSIPISMSNSSDPYQPLEKKMKLTRSCLKLFSQADVKLQIVTKSSLVVRDLDILKKMRVSISMTVTSLKNNLLKKLEPNAPGPKERLKAIKILTDNKIPVSVRIDPIIIGLNDDEIEDLVHALSILGVKHVVSSTYKVRPDNWKRLSSVFPELKNKLYPLYFEEGERISNYFYLKRSLRLEIMERVRDACDSEGMTFATCREGFPFLQTGQTCDGTHLIPE
ncbi:MAG: radical SAM protein [Candidatus Aenigmarchaeota archaeon]|nr:radical SAM protein [Candidatus Aenigmarchaeota archaeon]